MSIVTTIEPYVDGYIDPVMGNESTVSPRPRYPFGKASIPDTFTRFYERDFEIVPRSIPRISARTAWTNLLTYSEDFDNAAWTKTNLTVSANNRTAPNGDSNMDKLLESSATGEHSVSQAVTVTAAAHEVTVFYRGGLTRGQIRLAFTDSAATTFSAIFTTTGSALTAVANTTARLTNLRDGYFRAVIRFTPAAGAGTFKVNVSTTGSTISYAGSTSAGIYLWGAQVTLGSLTPYISTLGAARSILAPDRDPVDPFAYLFTESDPEPVNSHREIVRRTYGRIPRRQIVPGSRPIPKPQIAGDFPRTINGVLVDQPDEDTPEYVFFSQVAVTSDSGPPAFGITGGDFDLTIGPDTESAIAYNVSAAALQTLVNAMALVDAIGTVAVTGGGSSFSIQFTAVNQPTGDASSLTLVGAGTPTATLSGVTMAGGVFFFQVRFNGPTAFNGGTFTLTIFGETTAAIAWNATAQDIEDAINLLPNVGGGATVTVPFSGAGYTGNPLIFGNTQIFVEVQINFPTASVDGSSLTPSGTAAISQIYGAGWQLTLSSTSSGTRTITATSHGITTANDIVVTVGGVVQNLAAGTFGVPNANQITFTSAAGPVFYGGSITAVGTENGSRYAADSPDIAVEFITDHYLPGVSPNIDVWTDIPIPVRVTPAQLLGAIFGGSTLANYEVGTIAPYDETPVLTITLQTINPQLLVSPDV